MAGREMIVKIVGVAEGWEKASQTATQATAATTKAQTEQVDKLESAQRRLEDSVAESEKRIQQAREKSEDANRRVATAEAKLAEERERYGAESSRALAAEERLEKAKRDASAATGQITKEIGMQADAQERLTKVTEELNSEAEKSGGWREKLGGFASSFSEHLAGLATIAGTAAIAAGGALYKIGEVFDDVEDTIRTGTGATGGALDSLVESAKNVGNTIPAEFDQIGATIADVNTRFGLSGDQLETVAAQYLEAGRILGETIDINKTSSALSAFKIEGDDVSGALDYMFQVSQATGVGMNELADSIAKNAPAVQNLGFSYEETAALVGQLDKAGLDTDATLSAMSRGLVSLAKDGEEPQEAFRRITGEIQELVDTGDVAGAIDLASGVFGTRAANQFVGAVQSGTMALDDLIGQAGLSGDTILGVGAETMDFAESWQIVKNNALTALEPLGSAVFSALGDALSEAVPHIQQFGEWANENQGLIQGLAIAFGVLAGALGIAAAVQWAMNSAMLASPITWIIVGIVALVAGFVWLWNNVEGFRNFWVGAWDLIKGAALAVGDWFMNTLVPWFKSAGQTISDDFTALANWVGEKLEAIRGAGERVGTFFTVDVPGYFTRAKDMVIEKVTEMKDKGVAIFDGFVTGVGTVLDGIREAAAKPINFVIDLVWNDGLRRMIQGVLDLFNIDAIQLPVVEPIALARGAMMGDGRRPILWNEVPGQREAYIPINASTRSRDLWVQTGRELGAIEMATGGIWPTQGTITSPFGYRVGPYNGAEHHDGIDIGAPGGTPVVAVLPGMVTFAGWNGGYGNQVTIDHGGGLSTFYAHLQSINAALGDMVEAGTLIGGVGTTGWSTGNHLHWGASLNGASIDPSGIVSGDISASGQPGGSSGPFGFISAIAGFIDKLAGIGESPWAKLAGGAVRGMLDHVGDWVRERLFSWLPGNDAAGQGGNFDGWWAEAIAVAGPSWDQYKDAVRAVAQYESGMNPNAVNDWDSNAAAGIPSKGLLQFVEPTFRAHAWPGHNNWLSPVDQILAFFNYVPSRYGSIWNHPGLQGLQSGSGYVGYDAGGWLMPGATPALNATGQPEAVLTAEQWAGVAAMILALQQMLIQPRGAEQRVTVRIADDQFDQLARPDIHVHPTVDPEDSAARQVTRMVEAAVTVLDRKGGLG